ncbi:hypothetical protein DPMN_092562 [Dreissena polymorpha]|uniref:Uncharacterized protein n=1 Tax=Dreissena polymorpha TaxID=45954 RepID=A0A9D4R059_DREPO|nr:hypothetical protein DPMN_092562 [Dreissena polymorpha]
MVWNQLQRHLSKSEPRTKKELVQAIKAFWKDHMTVEQCKLYIDHLYKVALICIKIMDVQPVTP